MISRLHRVLILFSTVSGCTATIARRIGTDLIAYGVKPQVCSVEESSGIVTESFDACILGSGVRLGRWHKDMREWVMANIEGLSHMPVALFSVGLRGVMPDRSIDKKAFSSELEASLASVGVKPTAGKAFLPGWKQSEGFSAMEKLALRMYPLPEGDYRDWDLVDAWVSTIVTDLLRESSHSVAKAPVAHYGKERQRAAASVSRRRSPVLISRPSSFSDAGLAWEECSA